MSRTISLDGRGGLEIRFPFDRDLLEVVRALPNRRWRADAKFWWAPEDDLVEVVEAFVGRGFAIDADTAGAYRERGGALDLDAAPAPEPAGRRLGEPRGLFDSPTDPIAQDDWTVGALNAGVARVLENAFPDSVWLVGEISSFNRSAHRKHVHFELVERDDDGRERAKVSAVLFERARRELERTIAEAGDPFRLEDEVTVRLRVAVELYEPWGKYQVRVESIDPSYTLGEAARRREEILRKMTAEGLVGVNSGLPFPDLPLRVGLVTSLGSDAYNDVLRTLQESGYAFAITAHGARVQGHATEPSVLNALDWFRDRVEAFDVVLVCRGGGSRSDLSWFDTEPLGRAVATFPLPVVIGIGHEQDRSVLDELARRAKTPTAAAGLLVETVGRSLERLTVLGSEVTTLAARRLSDERTATGERALRVARAARHRLALRRAETEHRAQRLLVTARRDVAQARDALLTTIAAVPRAAAQRLARAEADLAAGSRRLATAARRGVATGSERLATTDAAIRTGAARILAFETERADSRARRLHLLDPRRVVERGYAIVRDARGHLITEAAAVSAGAPLRAELKRGILGVRAEGPIETTIDDERGEDR